MTQAQIRLLDELGGGWGWGAAWTSGMLGAPIPLKDRQWGLGSHPHLHCCFLSPVMSMSGWVLNVSPMRPSLGASRGSWPVFRFCRVHLCLSEGCCRPAAGFGRAEHCLSPSFPQTKPPQGWQKEEPDGPLRALFGLWKVPNSLSQE